MLRKQVVKRPAGLLLRMEALDDAHTGNVFVDKRIQVGRLFPEVLPFFVRAPVILLTSSHYMRKGMILLTKALDAFQKGLIGLLEL